MDTQLKEITKNYGFTQLSILQYIYKTLGEILSTKDPNSLRARIDKELTDAYKHTNVDRLRDSVTGATLSVVEKKPKETKTYTVKDDERFYTWLYSDIGHEWLVDYAREHDSDFFEYVQSLGGDIEGVTTTTTTDNAPASVKTTLRIDTKKARAGLENSTAGLKVLQDLGLLNNNVLEG